MLIVGERINTSRKGIEPAVRGRDLEFIKNEVVLQVAAGAGMIDVNAGTLLEGEPEALAWLTQVAQAEANVPLCLDSPNPLALSAALKVHKGKALINSISGEEERYRAIIPLAKEYQAAVVALTMDNNGIPTDAMGRLNVARKLIQRLNADGIDLSDIYIDPLVQPIGTDSNQGAAVLGTISVIKAEYPDVHVICGLSNVSYGLPIRRLLNRTFLAMCVTVGLDGVICDPLDRDMMKAIYASAALAGKDEFCMGYINAFREQRLD